MRKKFITSLLASLFVILACSFSFAETYYALQNGGTPADTSDVVDKACKRNASVTAWRKKFIGEPFAPAKFVEKLESYL